MQASLDSTRPDNATATLTVTGAPPHEESHDAHPVATLRLRGGPRKPRQRVEWREDVVDNEGSGKKSSKICCIYHKPKRFDESSDEDSSDSDSDSETPCRHSHEPHPDGSCQRRSNPRDSNVQKLEHPSHDHNAYEHLPHPHKDKDGE